MKLTQKRKSIVLIQGILGESILDKLSKNKSAEFFILEGRPSMKSARQMTAALLKRKVKPTLISDNMAGFLFYKNLVKEVWVGCQSAGDNGILCQVGGLILGVLGQKHKVPVYASAHYQQVQLLGNSKDITYFNGTRIAPFGVKGYAPLAEWVSRKYINKIYE